MEPVADIDKILDDILECHVNSEYRSSCYDFDDFIQTLTPFHIYSGSFVEGFSNYNDIDIMIDMFEFDDDGDISICLVGSVDDIPQDDKKEVWMLEKKGCYPGYVRIRQACWWWLGPWSVSFDGAIADYLSAIQILPSQLQYCINGRIFLKVLHQLYNYIGRRFELRGPALVETVNTNTKVDQVYDFKITSWPSNTEGFLNRMSDVTKKLSINEQRMRDIGCHVVIMSHPSSKDPDHEFRMSFSACEKYLLRNWTNKQMGCYFLCRELNKKYFSDVEKGICSYFWKTAMLWLIEEESQEFWSQPYLECIKKILDKMRCYLKGKSCPNYFIPENLMMSLYTTEQCEKLQKIIEDVSKNLFLHILNCSSFKNLLEDDLEILSDFEEDYLWSANTMVPLEYLSNFEEDYLWSTNTMQCIINNVSSELNENKRSKKNYLLQENQRFMVFMMYDGMIDNIAAKVSEMSFSQNQPSFENLHDREQTLFLKVLNAVYNRSTAFSVLESDNYFFSSAVKDPRILEDVEKQLISAIDVPGVLDDKGFSGYAYMALFYYITSNKEKALESVKSCCESYDQIPNDSLAEIKPLPVFVPGGRLCKAPAFLGKDKILCKIFKELHWRFLFLDPMVLAIYIEYQLTHDNELVKDLMRLSSRINQVLRKGENINASFQCHSYWFILWKLGLLNEDSKEYKFLSKPVTCRWGNCGWSYIRRCIQRCIIYIIDHAPLLLLLLFSLLFLCFTTYHEGYLLNILFLYLPLLIICLQHIFVCLHHIIK